MINKLNRLFVLKVGYKTDFQVGLNMEGRYDMKCNEEKSIQNLIRIPRLYLIGERRRDSELENKDSPMWLTRFVILGKGKGIMLNVHKKINKNIE